MQTKVKVVKAVNWDELEVKINEALEELYTTTNPTIKDILLTSNGKEYLAFIVYYI